MPACTTKVEESNAYVYEGMIHIPNQFSAGKTGSRVLVSLRDKGRMLGSKCPSCGMVFVPARSTCHECFVQIKKFVPVSSMGTVETYSVCSEEHSAQPVGRPIYAVIKLDGADTGFVHMLGEVEPENLTVGMRVKAVFKEKKDRKASILDIRYFKPL